VERRAEFCELLQRRIPGGFIPHQAGKEPKDHHCTSMMFFKTWQGHTESDTIIARISDSGNLRHTLHANTKTLNKINGYTPVKWFFFQECTQASAESIQIIAHETSKDSCQVWAINNKVAKEPPSVPRLVSTPVPKGPSFSIGMELVFDSVPPLILFNVRFQGQESGGRERKEAPRGYRQDHWYPIPHLR
jgi:hypothetical protein